MSSDDYDIEIKVKNYLLSVKIRLCDPPYTIDNEVGEELENLAKRIADQFNFEVGRIKNVLLDLRTKSLKNLENVKKFQNERIITLKIYLPKTKATYPLEISDYSTELGSSLKQKVSELCNLNLHIRLICKGKVIDESTSIASQGIVNNSKILVLEMNNDLSKVSKETDNEFEMSKTFANYLSKRALDGRFSNEDMSVSITNQSGEVLSLTKEEKSMLTYGLAMHQQGTMYLTNRKYYEALLHFLESDEAFKGSQYSDTIDNVAILQLDIVWTYYSMQNLDDIADAERRLGICEKRMRKCYGVDNERIQRIRAQKTFEGVPETVHVFRLYLLFAVLRYYQNRHDESKSYLNQARDLYTAIAVPTNLIDEVMFMGFTRTEAINALRTTKEIPSAIEYIFRAREDEEKKKLERKNQSRRLKIAKRLGYTCKSNLINLDTLELLINNTYMDPSLCLAAIRKADNDYNMANDLLLGDPNQVDMLTTEVELSRYRGEVFDGNISYDAVVREERDINEIAKLLNDDRKVIKRVLRMCSGNIEQATSMLLEENFKAKKFKERQSSSSRSTSSSDLSTDGAIEEELYKNFGEGSSCNAEDRYVNMELVDEIDVFNRFADLLGDEKISSQM